ncbi:MAG: hypothetical protein LBM96_05215 [Methanobrevibacter sp.]|jgi:hypothetical protein|nr:hypothetical protein [Candidatus Methanoflexus mossambicus]
MTFFDLKSDKCISKSYLEKFNLKIASNQKTNLKINYTDIEKFIAIQTSDSISGAVLKMFWIKIILLWNY